MNSVHKPNSAPRGVIHSTRGHGHGHITRLMSPSDLGEVLKPFVFLDIFDRNVLPGETGGLPIHPHSGIATVTVFTEGRMRFDDPSAGSGSLSYGGVEWMQAGGGIWHGKELSPDAVPRIQGFQLWLALPAERENSAPESRYIEAGAMARSGPAHVILGNYEGTQSPVPAQDNVNYLLVTLRAGESWTYRPPAGHTLAWMAVASGELQAGTRVSAGEMVVFEHGESEVALHNSGDVDAKFVFGSAIPHPHDLHLGNYSVHTSPQALASGERRIAQLRQQMTAASVGRRTAAGTVPVYTGSTPEVS